MEFGPGLWGPVIATGAMILGAFIGWLILLGNRKLIPAQPNKEKNRVYGCGEIIQKEETQADAEQFYSPIREVFGKFYQYILPGHSGDLSSYLIWLVSGFAIILVWIILELG